MRATDYKLPDIPADFKSRDDSVVFITMHKAGSSIAGLLFRFYAYAAGYIQASFAEDAKSLGLLENEFCIQHAGLLSTPGYYFGPFRGIYVGEMGGFSENRLIVQVRDPRDCICSNYFSISKSHVLPKDEKLKGAFLQMRERMSAKSIDQYALEGAKNYLQRMLRIKKIVENHPSWRLVKYEDMVLRTEFWGKQAEEFFGVEERGDLDEKLKEHLNFTVEKEDPNVHKRQVTPGDHVRKLKPETISAMNETLSPVLEWFGYPLEVTQAAWARPVTAKG